MSFDGFFTHAMVHELNAALATGRVARVSQPYPAELIMTIRAQRHNYSLLLSANPTYPRIQITTVPFTNPAVPTNFTMTLRKYLDGAILEQIDQVGNDRIVRFSFHTRDELGDRQQLDLIVEIMARHSNISLVNTKTNKIIDTIKHVGSDQNRVRLLLPGATFVMPPKQDKANPYLPNQLYSDLARQYDQPAELARHLQVSYEGLGRDSARDLADRLLTSGHLPTTYQQFIQHFDQPEPVIIDGQKKSFMAFPPLKADESTLQHFPTLSQLLDNYYSQKAQQDRSKELAGQVIKVIKNELKKDRRKVKKLEKQLADAISTGSGAKF